MTNFLISAFLVIVVLLPCCVRSMNNHSFFAFTHIDKKSPDDIEMSCLTINYSTLGTLYFGIRLFIDKNVSCTPKNVNLKEIRKDIIHDKHGRPLCRMILTVSIDSTHCEKAVVDLNFLCQDSTHLPIYFQDCKELSNNEKDETDTDVGKAITMSVLPAPVVGDLGPEYKIPKVQCILIPDASDSLTTKRLDTTTVNDKDFPHSHTLTKKPDDIEDSCLTINNNTPRTLYYDPT
uniref:Uncharacterized protein LOC111109735 isoform X2 n=1 Tax=Crassostrea virginica TaxID=6565 RepID=A0A8B8BE52_CRAVI|nr:uncharacterized protein LOC111109735 isoform X2 [Crassostrea virginica]